MPWYLENIQRGNSVLVFGVGVHQLSSDVKFITTIFGGAVVSGITNHPVLWTVACRKFDFKAHQTDFAADKRCFSYIG